MELVRFEECEDSEGVNERLEQLFDNYCVLFMRRFEEGRVRFTALIDFFTIAVKYGFKELVFRRFKEVAVLWMFSKLEILVRSNGLYGLRRDFNPLHAFLEIDGLECYLDNGRWLEEFMSPFLREEEKTRREARHREFKQRILLIREAVLNEDWPKVGAFLGHLPSFRQNLKRVPEAFRKQLGGNLDRTCRIIFPYASAIFRAGIERFMHYDIPRDIITKSAAELMLALIAAQRKTSNVIFDVENSSLLYITELLIHAVANGQEQEALDLISATASLPLVAQKHKYGAIFRAYKALFHYEQWRLGRGSDMAQSSSPDIADEIIAALVDVPSGQETVFICAAVHCLNRIGKTEVLMRALMDCCHKTPCMIVACHRALLVNNMGDEANQLLDAVLPVCNIVSNPILLNSLEPRLLNPHDYDLPEEMLSHACKLLFMYLDYGTNRNSDRAWVFLWVAVQHVQDENLLRAQWDARKSWWPKFHCVELSESGANCRSRVFVKLQTLCM